MTWSSFLIKLGSITTLLLITVAYLAHTYRRLDLLHIYQWSVLFFVIFCLVIFWYAHMIARRSNNFTFFGIVSGSFMLKLAGALLFLYFYRLWITPLDRLFVLHFIIVYIIYTVFEVYFLTKLAKTEP